MLRLYLTILSCILALVACSTANSVQVDNKTITSIHISRVGTDMNDIQPPHISYNSEDTAALQVFAQAIQTAKKVPGVVDVRTPDYVFTLTFQDRTTAVYSLWLDADGGSVMNEEDTHTIFTLAQSAIHDLQKYAK